MTESSSSAHREMRELLGAYALGDLPEDAQIALRAHVDGCPACRAELAEIAPLADDLQLVDLEALATAPAPPPDLGDRIVEQVRAERGLLNARARRAERRAALDRQTRRLTATAAAAVLVLAALGIGTAVGRSTAPDLTAAPPKPALPVEQIDLRTMDAAVTTESAVVVAHTWGVEAKFEARGLEAGEVYRAAFRTEDGRMLPAGEFLGVGDKTLLCNMQSALLRDDAVGFVVTDEEGQTVLVADL